MRRSGCAGALLAACLTTSCGVSRLQLPTGPGAPAADASEALQRATAACRGVQTITAEITVRGALAGRRFRAHLLAGMAAPSSVYLEAPAPFGPAVFIFAARGSDATLLLPRDRRVLEHGRASEVFEALAGVPLDGLGLRATLTGCSINAEGEGLQLGSNWRVIPGEDEAYLRRDGPDRPWRVVAVVHGRRAGAEWRVEYHDFQNDLPRTIRLASADARRFDLQLTLSQVEINVPIDAGTFTIQVPSTADPITLDELRRAGPLAEPSIDSRGR